jgi:hypothetical protein
MLGWESVYSALIVRTCAMKQTSMGWPAAPPHLLVVSLTFSGQDKERGRGVK